MGLHSKSIVAVALLIAALALVPQSARAVAPTFGGEQDAADVVVLLDLSQSTLPYFQDVSDFVVTSVVRDFLRYGDTFHLLSFGDMAQVEISQRMVDERDVKSVLGRLYLLYPLARYTDFIGALNYLYQYLADLPESRQKVAIVITDGVHNPPPGSPTFGYAPEKVGSEIESIASKIRAQGWPVHFIKLPFAIPGAGAPGAAAKPTKAGAVPQPTGSEAKAGTSWVDSAAKALGADVSEFSADTKAELARKSLSLPSVEFPPHLGKHEYAFSFPLKVTNSSQSQLGLELDRVRFGDLDILSKKAFLSLAPGKSGTMSVPVELPDSLATGEQRLGIELYFANGIRTSPQSGELSLDLERSPLAALFRSSARLALFALLLVIGLALVLAAILFLRRLPRRAAEPVVAAVRESSGSSMPAAAQASGRKTAAGQRAETSPAPAAAAQPNAKGKEARAQGAEAVPARKAETPVAGTPSQALPIANAGARPEGELLTASARAKADAKERDRAVAEAAESMAAAKRAEAERSAALLAEAAGRRQAPAAASREEKKSAARLPATVSGAYAPRVIRPGSVEIELRVEEQNPNIGTRNVHTLQAGTSKNLGGARSDFLVFLVPVPQRIAELHYDGEDLTLVPLRAELFPGSGGPIERCLGKDIKMIGAGGYPLTLRFVRHERPEARINRLLHCIEAPGLFREGEV